MACISVRVPDPLAKQVKRMAALRRVPEAEVWRTVIQRGLEAEDHLPLLVLVRTFALVQRLAGAQDRNLLAKAKEDARHMLAELGRLDGGRPRRNDDESDTYKRERRHESAPEER